jgi:hypothetical protein
MRGRLRESTSGKLSSLQGVNAIWLHDEFKGILND